MPGSGLEEVSALERPGAAAPHTSQTRPDLEIGRGALHLACGGLTNVAFTRRGEQTNLGFNAFSLNKHYTFCQVW